MSFENGDGHNLNKAAKQSTSGEPPKPYEGAAARFSSIAQREGLSSGADDESASQLLQQIEASEIAEISGNIADKCNSDSPGKYIGISKSARNTLGVELGDKVSILVDGKATLFTVRQATMNIVEKEKASGSFQFNMCVDYFDQLHDKDVVLKKAVQ